ncbi:MAG: hypothetical protein ACKOF7_05100 [Phycisphaerales bacterium]
MKNVSTGFGLCVAAAAALAYPFVSSLAPNADAVGIDTTAMTAVASAATSQGDPPAPTGVWMGVTVGSTAYATSMGYTYHRVWSNGRQEGRFVCFNPAGGVPCTTNQFSPMLANGPCFDSGWVEIPAPPGGNGFACRTDLNGDRYVNGDDLGIVLAAWGPSPACNPDPTFACVGFGRGIAP